MPNIEPKYKIVEIFDSIQGEGPSAGTPATFIRLAGCNLKCEFCDTDHAWKKQISIKYILDRVPYNKLVVITGGEPFLHRLYPLLEALALQRYSSIEIETNGTKFNEDMLHNLDFFSPDNVRIICSPKPNAPLHSTLKKYICAYKYIITKSNSLNGIGLPADCEMPIEEDFHIPIFVQSCDHGNKEDNARALKRTIKTAMQHGYRLSLQMHKLIGML